MKATNTETGLALAATAAALFALAPVAASAADDVKCMGVNACKGLSSCKTATSACTGLNSCKGQGYVLMSAEACTAIGGKEG